MINSKNIAKVYLNEDEANFYAKKYNGIVHTVSSSYFVDVMSDDDNFVENLFDTSILEHDKHKHVYLLVCERKQKLEETLLPIKHFIYTKQRLKNLLIYRQLINNGLKCYGIKTDGLLTDANETQLTNIFTFDNKIGGIKIEKNKQLSKNYITMDDNLFEETQIKSINKLYF